MTQPDNLPLPGEFFPRMARPYKDDPKGKGSPGYNPDPRKEAPEARVMSAGQLHAMIAQLEQICRVVYPQKENYDAFGHEIRNILILGCTEVETQWKRILKENGIKEKRMNIEQDYSKLLEAMKLNEYEVELTYYYPHLPKTRPFEEWKKGKTLPWWSAYNAVKHDREVNFKRATLLHALTSVTGCFVMLCAQYGWDFALSGDEAVRAFFRLVGFPSWSPSEMYVRTDPPKAREYKFD